MNRLHLVLVITKRVSNKKKKFTKKLIGIPIGSFIYLHLHSILKICLPFEEGQEW